MTLHKCGGISYWRLERLLVLVSKTLPPVPHRSLFCCCNQLWLGSDTAFTSPDAFGPGSFPHPEYFQPFCIMLVKERKRIRKKEEKKERSHSCHFPSMHLASRDPLLSTLLSALSPDAQVGILLLLKDVSWTLGLRNGTVCGLSVTFPEPGSLAKNDCRLLH